MKKCFECETTKDLHEHHVVPRSRGGTKTVTLCYQCHMKAHGRDGKGLEHNRLTKQGLKVAKERGVKLGGANPIIRQAVEKQSLKTIKKYKPIFEDCLKNPALTYRGKTSLNAIARYLTEQGVETPRGKLVWSSQQVKQIFNLIKKEKK